MKVPYSKQKEANSCGAAVAQMMIKFYGIETNQNDLIKELKINKIGYTKKQNLRDLFEKFELSYKEFAKEVTHDSKERLVESGKLKIVSKNNLEHMLNHIDKGTPAIVNFSPNKHGHYVIVHSYDNDNLIVHDPAKGSDQKIKKKEFDQKWKSGNKKWNKWYMVVEKKNNKN